MRTESVVLHLVQTGNYVADDSTKTVQKATATLTSAEKTKLKSKVINALSNPSTSGTSLSVSISDLAICMGTTINESMKSSVVSAIQEILNGDPDLFYISNQFSYTYWYTSGKWYFNTLTFKYSVPASYISVMRSQYNSAINAAVRWIPANASDTLKAKAAHDWLVRNCAYNSIVNSRLNSGDGNPATWWYNTYGNLAPWTSFGALVGVNRSSSGSWTSRQPVCEGYSLAYIAILARVGIKADFVQNSNAGHGWNRVLTDGKWHHVDVTWDDALLNGRDQGSSQNLSRPTYFIRSDSFMRSKASSEKNRTHATWSPSSPSCGDTTYDSASRSWTEYKTTASNPSTAIAPNWATFYSTVSLSASNCTVTIAGKSSLSYAYNGQTHVPARSDIVVKYNGKTLVQGSDYQIVLLPSGSDAVIPGTKNIVIRGAGDYSGSFTKTYTITASLSQCTRSSIPSVTYTGKAQKKVPTITWKNGSYTKMLVQGTDFTVTFPSNVTSVGTKKCTIKGKGAFSGTMTYTYSIVKNSSTASSRRVNSAASTVSTKAVYWLVHRTAGENLYTTDKNEVAALAKGNWINKGIVWYAPTSGTPVYRLYAKKINDHHYTADINEVKALTRGGTWKLDGGKVMWYSGGSKQTYRLFSPSRNAAKKPGTHRFATSIAQVSSLKKQGWNLDGVKMYAVK